MVGSFSCVNVCCIEMVVSAHEGRALFAGPGDAGCELLCELGERTLLPEKQQ